MHIVYVADTVTPGTHMILNSSSAREVSNVTTYHRPYQGNTKCNYVRSYMTSLLNIHRPHITFYVFLFLCCLCSSGAVSYCPRPWPFIGTISPTCTPHRWWWNPHLKDISQGWRYLRLLVEQITLWHSANRSLEHLMSKGNPFSNNPLGHSELISFRSFIN